MHLRINIIGGEGNYDQSAVEEYWVLGIYTKTYNTWYLCNMGKKT